MLDMNFISKSSMIHDKHLEDDIYIFINIYVD